MAIGIGDRVIAGNKKRHGSVVCFLPNKKYVKVRIDDDGISRDYAIKRLATEPPTAEEIEAAIDELPRVSLEDGMRMRGQATPNSQT